MVATLIQTNTPYISSLLTYLFMLLPKFKLDGFFFDYLP